MLCQPALLLGNTWSNAQSEALLPQQGVSSVTTAERDDLSAVWDVGDQRLLRVTGPVVHQGLWERNYSIWITSTCDWRTVDTSTVSAPTVIGTVLVTALQSEVAWVMITVWLIDRVLKHWNRPSSRSCFHWHSVSFATCRVDIGCLTFEWQGAADRVQAANKLARPQGSQHSLSHAGHHPHAGHHIGRIGQFHPDLGEGGSHRAHAEGNHVHGATWGQSQRRQRKWQSILWTQ